MMEVERGLGPGSLPSPIVPGRGEGKRWPAGERPVHFLAAPTALVSVLLTSACFGTEEVDVRLEGAAGIVEDAVRRHGGDLFEHARISFKFREAEFDVLQDGGSFRYERRYTDGEGRSVVEAMDNEGTYMEVDGEPVELTPEERYRVETVVNSTVYFGFLPFRLLDPAAHHRDLGPIEVLGQPYRMIEVTFDRDGGGTDWEDRFIHWIHEEERTLDYFAYRYHRDGGGTRFRRGINRREVDGLLIQDFENYRATEDAVTDIAEYTRLMESGALELLSVLELEQVRVERLR
jgi:hypothetical protein